MKVLRLQHFHFGCIEDDTFPTDVTKVYFTNLRFKKGATVLYQLFWAEQCIYNVIHGCDIIIREVFNYDSETGLHVFYEN